METKPDKAVSIIECDMNVSTFAAYKCAWGEGRWAVDGPCRPVPLEGVCSPWDCLGERGGS